MLTTEEIKTLSRPSARRTWIAIGIDWVLIAGLFSMAAFFPHPVVYLFCFILMARQQLALAIMMHDAAHRRLFRSATLNDIIAQIFLASPLFFSVFGYRRLHLKHHRDPLVSDDPDISLTGGYPIPQKSLARKLLRDLFGISYLKFIKYFFHMTNQPHRAPKNDTESSPSQKPIMGTGQIVFWHLAINSTLVGTLILTGHGLLYLTLWFLPMVTALQFLLRIRGITEHAGYQPSENQMLNTRTVLPSWQTLLFAPHQVNYHIEHHVYTGIPWFNLPKTHKLLRSRGSLPDKNLFQGYRQVLKELVH